MIDKSCMNEDLSETENRKYIQVHNYENLDNRIQSLQSQQSQVFNRICSFFLKKFHIR